MGFMDKAKKATAQAATKAKEGAEDVKTRRDLGNAYDELGKLAFDLAESGEIKSEKLVPLVDRIKALKAQLAD